MTKRKLTFVIFLVSVFIFSNVSVGATLLAPVEDTPSPLPVTYETTTPAIAQEATTSINSTTSTPEVLPVSDPVIINLTSSTQPLPSGNQPSTSSVSSPTSNVLPPTSNIFTPAKDSEARKSNLAKISTDLQEIFLSKSSDTSQILKIESDLNQVKVDLESVKSELISKNAPPKILDRLELFRQNYESKVQTILTELQSSHDAQSLIDNFLQKPSPKIENPAPFRAVEFNGQIKKVSASEFPKTAAASQGDLLKNLIKSTTINFKNILNPKSETSNILPLTSNVPNPADLDEAEEIKFTQSIKNLAVSLGNDPLTIFNYVSNNINYVPYYGSKKGADATLIEKAGNDFDQASLLIALLRAGDTGGLNKTPAHYKQASVKLDLGRVMDLLGVEDPIVAATIFEKTGVPYVLYVDQNQQPLFFVIEITYAEAYVDYDYSRGVIQGNPGAPKRWVPLVPFLASYYKSQHLNALDDMNFNAQTFYDNFLNGSYGAQKPIDALKSDIQNYLIANHPDLTPEDTYVQTYRSEENLEFLPLTLPFELVNDLDTFSAAPDNLKHRLNFVVESSDASQTFLNYTANISSLADKELLLESVAATPDDQAVIDSFPTIYDVVPLSLANLKPVIKINGQILSGGGSGDSQIQMGLENKLKLIFKSPSKELGGSVAEKIIDSVEKTTISGNSEGIAINTDSIAPPEVRPATDTQTSSPIANQKLYKTAQNYLYRLQTAHDDLARVTGGRFTNSATRAIVFNGLDVNYQSGAPYSFSWKGLRIDSSAVINYYSHFSTNPGLHQKEFLYVFGLQASQDEADIFENDFQVASISTVKGLKLINQNQIPGVTVKKISLANISEIDSLNISDSTKTKLRDAVHQGHIVYVPSQQFTYQSWTGLVYIDLNPVKGDGGYVIGEGLNGGFTACTLPGQGNKSGNQMCEWSQGLFEFWKNQNVISSVQAVINLPRTIYTLGEKIFYSITYSLSKGVQQLLSFNETTELDSRQAGVGNTPINSKYGTNQSASVEVKTNCLIGTDTDHCDYDNFIASSSERYGMPPGILKAIIHKETQSKLFDPKTSRYEPLRDFEDFSGYDENLGYPKGAINSPPFSYYKLPGINSQSQHITNGSRVDSLKTDYRTTLRNTQSGGWQLRGIITTDHDPKDGILTVADLYANDYDLDGGVHRQGWPLFGNPPSFIGNFTPQFLISSSYGLGHVMYKEATEALDPQGANIMKDSYTPHDIVDKPDLGIELTASILKGKFNGLIINDNCGGWSVAVKAYNGLGATAEQYKKDVCEIYSSKYK